MTTLTRAETILMQEYLEDCGEEFGGRTCNDFFLPLTPGNLAVFTAVCRAHQDQHQDQDDEFTVDDVVDGDQVFIFIDWVLGYLGQRCKDVLQGSGNGVSLSGAELHVMAAALQYAYEVLDDLSHEESFGATLPASADNKAMISAALRDISPVIARCTDVPTRASAMKAFKAAAEGVRCARGSGATVDVPTHWLMYYFSRKCADLSETLARSGALNWSAPSSVTP